MRSMYIVQSQIIPLGSEPFHIDGSLRSTFRPMFESPSCFKDLRLAIYDHERVNGPPNPPYEKFPVTHAPFIRNLGQVVLHTKRAFYVDKGYDRSVLAKKLTGRECYWEPQDETDANTPSALENESFFGYEDEFEDQRMHFFYFELRHPLNLRASIRGQTMARGKVFVHFYPSGYIGLHCVFSLTERCLKGADQQSLFSYIQECRPGRKGSQWQWHCRLGDGTLHETIDLVMGKVSQSMFEDHRHLITKDKEWKSAISVVSDQGIDDLSVLLFHTKPSILRMNSTIGGNITRERLHASPQGLIIEYSPIRRRASVLHSFWRIMHMHEFLLLKMKVYEDYIEAIKGKIEFLRARHLYSDNFEGKVVEVYDPNVQTYLQGLDRIIRKAEPFYRAAYSVIGLSIRFNERRDRLKDIMRQWEEELRRINERESLLQQLFEWGKDDRPGDIYINLGQVGAMGYGANVQGYEFNVSIEDSPAAWEPSYVDDLDKIVTAFSRESEKENSYWYDANWMQATTLLKQILDSAIDPNKHEEDRIVAVNNWREWLTEQDKDDKSSFIEEAKAAVGDSPILGVLYLHKKVKF